MFSCPGWVKPTHSIQFFILQKIWFELTKRPNWQLFFFINWPIILKFIVSLYISYIYIYLEKKMLIYENRFLRYFFSGDLWKSYLKERMSYLNMERLLLKSKKSQHIVQNIRVIVLCLWFYMFIGIICIIYLYKSFCCVSDCLFWYVLSENDNIKSLTLKMTESLLNWYLFV